MTSRPMAASEAPASVAEVLADILAEVRGIREALEQRGGRSTLTRNDLEALRRLLPAIAGAIGSELFTARELIRHAAPGLQAVCAGMSAKSLGRLLKRAHGIPVDGYVVRAEGLELGAVLWRILQTP